MTLDWRPLTRSARDSAEWSHAGIAVGADGTVYWADVAGGAIIALRPRTGGVDRIAVPLLEIHDITVDPDVTLSRLWLADPGFKMRPPDYQPEVRAGRAGSLDLTSGRFADLDCPEHPRYAQDSWRPTSIAVGDAGSLVVVADGYGAGLVHLFRDGRWMRTIDGADGAELRCPHGVAFVDGGDGPEIVVADRGNSRLLGFDLEGGLLRAFAHPSVRSPSGLAVLGDRLVVTDLDGALLSIDLDRGRVDELVPFPSEEKRPGWPNEEVDGATVRPPLRDGTLNSPHGVATTPDGSIVLTEWVIGGRELRLVPSGSNVEEAAG